MINFKTLEGHRQRGYAHVCLVALARKLISLGVRPYAVMEPSNAPSIGLFVKAGFRRAGGGASFVAYKPRTPPEDGRKSILK